MNDDPVFDELLRAHKKEAGRLGVEFTNFGWASDENGICSKTTKGILDSSINPNTMQVSHSWITYEERARREEQQKRDMRFTASYCRLPVSIVARHSTT